MSGTSGPAAADRPDPTEVRRFLAGRLPAHAVPAAVVVVPALPVTVNGKLDQAALPAPAWVDPAGQAVAPRTDAESRMATLWREVLELPTVGSRDDFFALGGNSLAAARLMVRVAEEFGAELPLTTLLEAGTVEALTNRAAAAAADAAQCQVPLRPGGSRPPLFLVHGLGGELLSYEALARHLGSDQPVYGFRARPPRDGERYEVTIEGLAAAYVAELLRFRPDGPYLLGGYSSGGLVAYEMARHLVAQGRGVAAVLVVDHRRPGRDIGRSWDPVSVARAGLNLPQWVRHDLLPYGLASLWPRLRRKAREVRRWLSGSAPEVHDVADVGRLPARFQEQWRGIFRAVRSYDGGPYPGRVWLVRASAQPLLPGCWHQADMGWNRFARGVTATQVRGNHDTLLQEPNAALLAATIRRVFAAAG